MKFIRFLFLSLVVLFLVLTFLFSLFPSHIRISRVISVHAGKREVMQHLQEFPSWPQWNFMVSDRSMPSGHWTLPPDSPAPNFSNETYSLKIDPIWADSLQIQFSRKGSKTLQGKFLVYSQDSALTDLQWYLDFHFRWYPWEKLSSMFYDKQLGPQMDSSLLKFKMDIEKNQ